MHVAATLGGWNRTCQAMKNHSPRPYVNYTATTLAESYVSITHPLCDQMPHCMTQHGRRPGWNQDQVAQLTLDDNEDFSLIQLTLATPGEDIYFCWGLVAEVIRPVYICGVCVAKTHHAINEEVTQK